MKRKRGQKVGVWAEAQALRGVPLPNVLADVARRCPQATLTLHSLVVGWGAGEGPSLHVSLASSHFRKARVPSDWCEQVEAAIPEEARESVDMWKGDISRTSLAALSPWVGVSVASLLLQAKAIVVVCGAGISTDSGIPDFRSDEGIFHKYTDLSSFPEPQCLFDEAWFRLDPLPLCSLLADMYFRVASASPNLCHRFLLDLHKRGKLKRVYTQNIDGLELRAGVPLPKVRQMHGSLSSFRCSVCRKPAPLPRVEEDLREKKVPKCGKCGEPVRPGIVLYGEPILPPASLPQDLKETDLLLVFGTSLRVKPAADFPHLVPWDCPTALLNADLAGKKGTFDSTMVGRFAETLVAIYEEMGWAVPEI